MLYGHKPHIFRILCTIEGDTVFVLHVRHGLRSRFHRVACRRIGLPIDISFSAFGFQLSYSLSGVAAPAAVGQWARL